MRITLAYPFDGHAPDETIEVPDALGQRLIREGRARRPAPVVPLPPPTPRALLNPDEIRSLRRMRVDPLRAFAAENGIDLGDARRKAEILVRIEASPVRTDHAPFAE